MEAVELVKSYACGEETYHLPLDPITGLPNNQTIVHRHHVFLETTEKFYLTELREMIMEFLGQDETKSFDVQTCRSRKSWLIYLSKEDYHPHLINVRISELSLFARAKHHASNSYTTPIARVREDDHMVVSARQNVRFFKEIIMEHLRDISHEISIHRTIYEPNRRCSIVKEILTTLQHMYIEGEPGAGKTELVDYMVQGRKCWKAGEPSSFLFGTLEEDVEIIWFENYDAIKYANHLATILSLIDQKPVTISKKGSRR
jgi:hypothetical protein